MFIIYLLKQTWFQHTAARRRLGLYNRRKLAPVPFQHTAARRRLGWSGRCVRFFGFVSTHSRPKAAGPYWFSPSTKRLFQHTAARRRLAGDPSPVFNHSTVSTHSRPKAAGDDFDDDAFDDNEVSTHSRPKAAGACLCLPLDWVFVSTHSRPKAAGFGCQPRG